MGRIVLLMAMIGVLSAACSSMSDPAREACSMCHVAAPPAGGSTAGCVSPGIDEYVFPPELPDGGADPCLERGCFPSCGGSDGGYDETSSTTCLPGAPLPQPICVTRAVVVDGG